MTLMIVGYALAASGVGDLIAARFLAGRPEAQKAVPLLRATGWGMLVLGLVLAAVGHGRTGQEVVP